MGELVPSTPWLNPGLELAPPRPVARPRQGSVRLLSTRAFWLLVSAAACILAYVGLFAVPINHDAGWLLYVARRVMGGAVLYRDIIEVNPPLIVGFAIAIEEGARALGIADVIAFPIFVGLVVGAALFATASLLRRLPGLGDTGRRMLVAVAAFLLFPFAGREFGQREHLMFALFLPYVLLAALRTDDREPLLPAALAIGIVAGLAISLKPYFLFVLLPVELYLAALVGWRRAPRRPELLAAIATMAVYVAAVLVITPAYLHVVRYAWATYDRFFRWPYGWILLNARGGLVLAAVLVAFIVPGHAELRALRHLLLLVMLGFLAALLWERKGWAYHWLPVLSAALLLLALVAVDVAPRLATALGPVRARLASGLALVALATLLLAGAAQRALHPMRISELTGYPYYLPGMLQLVEQDGGKGPIMALSTQLQTGFPLVNLTGIGWATRFNSLWPLAGLYGDVTGTPDPFPYHDRDHMSADERTLVDAYVEDFVRERPTLLVVDQIPPSRSMTHFNYLAYFMRDPRFAAAFDAHYRLLAVLGAYVIYRRRPDATPAPATGSDAALQRAPSESLLQFADAIP